LTAIIAACTSFIANWKEFNKAQKQVNYFESLLIALLTIFFMVPGAVEKIGRA